MIDLQRRLTNISCKSIQFAELQTAFDEIALILLSRIRISTPREHFYVREIEFYFYNEEIHPDPYSHKHKRQAEFGEWYFHRFNTIESFLKSNRNGIDITFGNKEENCFGGILIRKIQNVNKKELIVGINKVVRELIKNIGEENTDEVALNTGQKAFDKSQILHLEIDANIHSVPVYKTQRNGLTFRDDELSRKYFKIPYCYYNHDLNIPQIIEVRPTL